MNAHAGQRHGAADAGAGVAMITGAAQGIGLAVARAMARGGAKLSIADLQTAGLQDVAPVLRGLGAAEVLVLPLDVRDAAATEAAVRRTEQVLGPIDTLVNAAGVLRTGTALGASTADWAECLAVNLHGVVAACTAVAVPMRTRRRGSIVTIVSNAAATPRIGLAAYAASKAAALQYMRCLALELAGEGVRCNTVSPGSTDTAMLRGLWQRPEDESATLEGSLAQFRLGIPLGRIASADDVAEAVCYLASDRARHVTMHDLRVDGGASFDA